MAKSKKRGRPKKRPYEKKLRQIPSIIDSKGRKSTSIVELTKHFFWPLMKSVTEPYRSDRFSYFLELFFNANTRSLNWYRATEPFEIPGGKYIAGAKLEHGTGKREINENDLLLVVEDDTLEFVKVEVCRKKTQHNYQLSIPQWNFIKDKLRRV